MSTGQERTATDLVSIQPVILAGGGGARLWPLSRAGHPKQFLALADGKLSLFQEAVQRMAALVAPPSAVRAPLIVSNEEHRFLAMDQLREIGCSPNAVLLEPTGRNTAAALTLAALHALEDGSDPVLVVSPADHVMGQPAACIATLREATRVAISGAIVILGVAPDRPETGYGYFRSETSSGGSRVVEFAEKPDLATAERYLEVGGYCWNSGIYVLRASVWLAALEHFRPDILAATRTAWEARNSDAFFVRPGRAEFGAIPSASVDHAVTEPATATPEGFTLRMLPLDAGWNDLGAWEAVWNVSAKDEAGNAAYGDALLRDSRNTLVHATSRLVGVVGMDNVVVVETPDAVLVTDRSRSQQVRQIVAELDRTGRSEQTLHRKMHRPWGWYHNLDAGPRFQVKRLIVKPGASLSLQMHHHRAEHWIVVTGTAEVTCGDMQILLTENQSTYIPLGEKHRLANPGKVPLEIIEVQSGSYLAEDDIVRFEDAYGRG